MRNKHQKLFDRIANVYGLYFDYQKRKFDRMLDRIVNELDLFLYHDIIDFGCGTGALCSELYRRGFRVTGVDASSKMLEIAKRKMNGEIVDFVRADLLEGTPFEDKSFDVSIASFVAHGLKPEERKKLYQEMKRVTRSLIIIYDYNQKRSLQTNILESLEGGDYFGFIENIKAELNQSFDHLQVIDQGDLSACYIVRL